MPILCYTTPMKHSGFTLLELLITITIAGIILSTGFYSFFSLQKSMRIIDNQKDILLETNHTLSILRDTVRYSNDLKTDINKYVVEDNKLYYNGISMFSDMFVVDNNSTIELIESDNKSLQPRVHIVLQVQHKALEEVKAVIDTSLSSRYYTLKYQ